MTKTLSAAIAKAQFSDCLREVEQGGEVLITRYGRPVAVLVSMEELDQLRRLRAASPMEGLAGLLGQVPDGDEYAESLDAVVAERSVGRTVAPVED
ncbi:MAG: type II toxin-antitoxin system Phd/YefM family antitoxin [Myxococcota bacterium]|nr:type II toxin-antitoxin system Phd/YefM family antitoxin [Myxococcota bacterium]